MKNSNHNTILAKIAARAARHLTAAALLFAILVALPLLACADAVETTLASFDGTNGHYPTQGLLLASDGNFYGTTPSYGADNGTIFRITPTGTLTTIYRFSGLADESNPLAALIQGSDGNLYGTTAGGISPQYGTVFKLHARWNLDHALCLYLRPDDPNLARRQRPRGGACGRTGWQLLWHDSGRREPNGGASPYGTIFEMSPAGALLGRSCLSTSRHPGIRKRRLSLGPTAPSIARPTMAVALGSGTVYQFSAAGVVTVLHGFNDTPDGNMPNGGLVLGSDGNFYGTTEYGGTSHLGTAYRISPGGTYQELISFDNSNGAAAVRSNDPSHGW